MTVELAPVEVAPVEAAPVEAAPVEPAKKQIPVESGKTTIPPSEAKNQEENFDQEEDDRVFEVLSVSDQDPFFETGGNWADAAKEFNHARQGELLNLKAVFGKRPKGGDFVSHKRRRRGKIKGFSYQSRNRLLKQLHTIDYERMGVPLFLTLTYPAVWKKDFQVWKDDLDRFFHDYLGKKYTDSCLVWKTEPQQRGAPHFHCLVFGAESLNTTEGREWVAAAWYHIVGSADERHLRAGTRVESCKSLNQLRKYLLKYIGKEEAYTVPFGRIWGLCGRRKLVFAPIIEGPLRKGQFLRLRRVIRKYLAARRRLTGGKKRRYRDMPGGCWVILPPSVQQRVLDHILLGSPDSS